MSYLWFHYFWTSLQGNGPEDIVSTIALAILASLIWPPTRKRMERFAQRHLRGLKDHVSAENDLIHQKLDHVIFHSKDIPEFKPKGRP